jgi:hypothetical protein
VTSLVVPAAVVALANKRLRDADEALSRKLEATTVNPLRGGPVVLARNAFGPTERRVLAMVRAAGKALGGADQVDLPASHPLAPGPSRFAVLGSAGFEIPAYTDMFSAAGSWRADVLRRGNPDPSISNVVVGTTQLAFVTATKALATAADDAAKARARAFSLGLLGAVASGVVAGPVQRGAHARRSPREWTRHDPSAELRAADALLAGRLTTGPAGEAPSRLQAWWPLPADVPDALLTAYLEAIEEVYKLQATRPTGRPPFEKDFEAGPALDLDRLKSGYARLRTDQAASRWSAFQWFGVLSPMLVSPPLALALARLLPQAKRFTTSPPLTERSVSELLTLTELVSSVTPFIYSMFLWSQVPDHTEAFVNALVIFIARLGLLGAWIPTIGTETSDPIPALRWIVESLLLGADVYALIRGIVALGGKQRGNSLVFFLQAMPGAMALTTTGIAAVMKAAHLDSDIGSWIGWGVLTAGLLFGLGIPLSMAMASGEGYLSWFRTDQRFPPLSSIGIGDQDADGTPLAFDDSTLWFDPTGLPASAAGAPRPNLADLHYPSGARPVVRVWWEGGGDLKIGQGGDRVTFTKDGADTVVRLGAGQRAPADVATALAAALAGVKAEAIDDGPVEDLAYPAGFADPGFEQADLVAAKAHAADTAKVGTTKDAAFLLRRAARSAVASPLALGGGSGAVRIAPSGAFGDVEATAIGTAADLAVLLALGASPTLVTIDPAAATGAPAGNLAPVFQVFRQWNLDERRANEWRMLVSGGAASEKAGVPKTRDAAMRPDPAGGAYESKADAGEPIANAMGWVPLWRAWLRVAADTTADASSPQAMPYTPTVRTADGTVMRPTNAQLTDGIRYLLDLT